MNDNPLNRRDFLRGATITSLSSIGLALAGTEITAHAQAKPAAGAQKAAVDDDLKGRTVTFGVIGLGARGKEILTSLAKMGPQYAKVVGICDSFKAPTFIKKSQAIVPDATFDEDYRKILDNKAIEAVFIATPTHKHKQIVLDAIAAGKHVYCEAPLSNDLAEAKAIAQAGQAAKAVFQTGLQIRCNAQSAHVFHFMQSRTAGKLIGARAQWHANNKWRTAWPTPEREAEINWRLNKETSSGLFGEVGMHQIDMASWYYRKLPIAVTALGSIMKYPDGRTVPDTVQALIEFPGNFNLLYDATLASSFDDVYELYFGTDATIMTRDQRGWMFKEADANQLGWEVFARKDVMQIGKPENGTGLQIGTGVALVANATKQLAQGKEPGAVGTDVTKSALYQACAVFLKSVRAGQRVPVMDPSDQNPKPPVAPGALEGYQATVMGIVAHRAATEGKRIAFDESMFAL
jgi:predicted dehydrogenase